MSWLVTTDLAPRSKEQFYLEIVPVDGVAVVGTPLRDAEAGFLVKAARLGELIHGPKEDLRKAARSAPLESGGEQGLASSAPVTGRVHEEEPKLHTIWIEIPPQDGNGADEHAHTMAFLGVVSLVVDK